MTAIIDPRIPTGRIYVREAQVLPAWKLTRVDYLDETQAGGKHHIFVRVLDEHAAPKQGVLVENGWPTVEHPDDIAQAYTDERGEANFGMYVPGALCPADPHKPGPHWACVAAGPSDIAGGMCLPGAHHVSFLLTFVWTEAEPEPPPPTPPPGATRLETAIAALNASHGAPTAFTYKDEAYFAAGNMDTGIIVRRPRDGAVWMQWPEEL